MASAIIINPGATDDAGGAEAHRPSVSVVRELNDHRPSVSVVRELNDDHRPSVSVVRELNNERGISTPLGVIARLSLAAAALSLTIAAGLSLIVWGVAGFTTSDGGATAAGLAAAGVASAGIFLKIKN